MMEKRADMYVSTLRNNIEAMGDELKITAEFPDGSIQIEQFEAGDAEKDQIVNEPQWALTRLCPPKPESACLCRRHRL
jgi:hypothetical protein